MKRKITIACNFDPNTGEGRLAHLFIEQMGLKAELGKLICFVPKSKSRDLNVPGSKIFKYCSVYLWLWSIILRYRMCSNTEMLILNYLPIWNFITFLLVPASAQLAPITGSSAINLNHLYAAPYQRILQVIIRNFLLVYLSKLSSHIIKLRGLSLKPATPFVSKYLHRESGQAFFITTSLPKLQKFRTNERKNCYDLVAYTNDHPLKNNHLLKCLIPLLAKYNMRLAVIARGQCVHEFLDLECDLFENINHEKVVSILNKSDAVLICSLEGAGFFAQEAAYLGLKIFCFPDTGASFLPGANILCNANQRPSAAKVANSLVSKIKRKNEFDIANKMDRFIYEAKDYFSSDN